MAMEKALEAAVQGVVAQQILDSVGEEKRDDFFREALVKCLEGYLFRGVIEEAMAASAKVHAAAFLEKSNTQAMIKIAVERAIERLLPVLEEGIIICLVNAFGENGKGNYDTPPLRLHLEPLVKEILPKN